MSVRRDLRRLEEQGRIRRTHGGAVFVTPSTSSPLLTRQRGLLEAGASLVDQWDVLVVTPIKAAAVDLLAERALRSNMPVIAEAISYPGAKTVISIDDYGAGLELGHWVGRRFIGHPEAFAHILVVSSASPNCQARGRGFADGLRDVMPGRFVITQVDGKDVRQKVKEVAAGAFAVHPEINVIVGVNDDSALGALDAYRAAGLEDGRLLVVSFGLEGDVTKDLLAARGPYQAAVAMFPELVGRACIDASICAYHKCALPERVVMPTTIITADDLDHFYQRDDSCGQWRLDPVAAERLSASSPTLALLDPCPTRPRPSRVGLVEVFSSHEWYRNLQAAMASRARDMGIRFEVIDASQDLDRELDHLARIVGRAAAGFVEDGDTLILDTGKATAHLAAALHGRKGLTVITNSLTVLSELADEPGLRLISSGGIVRGTSHALIGRSAEEAFESLRANKAFITGSGLSIQFGLSHTSTSELGVKQAMLCGAREIIVLLDHTAVGAESLVKVAPLESIHRLITDSGISAHDRAALTQQHVEVTVADG